jgi:hypothetical protein
VLADLASQSLVIAAVLGLVAPVSPQRSMPMPMPLCGGGSVPVDFGGKRRPAGDPAPCHAACTRRWHDDDGKAPARTDA